MALSPADTTVALGAEFDLTLQITAAGSAFNGFDAYIGFDPDALTSLRLSPLSLQEGALMKSACGSRFHLFRTGSDRDTITDVLLCSGVSVTGPGQIYRLHFKASSTPHNTTVTFLPGLQFYNDGQYVNPSHSSDATIHVGCPRTLTATAGTGGTIGPSGTVTVSCGAAQTFTITPGACHHVADVVVDGVSQGPISSYTFTNVQVDHTIAATFGLNGPYSITANAGVGGSIGPGGTVSVACGADQSFTIDADSCHSIADVVVDGVTRGALSSYTFSNVQGNHTIDATFARNHYTIAASADAGGAIAPSGDVAVACADSQTFAISAAPGYAVADVSVDGRAAGSVTGYTFLGVNTDHTIHATFTAIPYSIALTSVGRGAVAKEPDRASYSYGDVVTVAASPADGWAFVGWSGDASTASNPIDVTIGGALSFVATFADTAAPVVSVVAPNGGEILGLGQVVALQWTATDNANVAAVDLRLSRTGAGGPYETIAANEPNGGNFAWTVTSPPSADAWFEVVARDSAGNTGADRSDAAFRLGATNAVESPAIHEFALGPVAPNPVTDAARLYFDLPRASHVRLEVLDVQGRGIETLVDELRTPGRHSAQWRTGSARLRPKAGVYLVRLTAGERTFLRKCVLAP